MKIWTDPKIEPLPADARYLFLYLITNEHRNESGLYSLTIRTMANETGLTEKRVSRALADLQGVRRVAYDEHEGVIWVVNAAKHTPMNDNCIRSIEKDLEFCSSPVLKESFCRHYANNLSLQQVIKRFANGSETVWNGFIEPTIQGIGDRVQGTGHKVQGTGKEPIEVLTHPLQLTISQSYPNVASLDTQLTPQQCDKLIQDYPKTVIKDVLDAMENKRDLKRKYTSVYLTINNWCKIRTENGNGTHQHGGSSNNQTRPSPTLESAQRTLEKTERRIAARNRPDNSTS